MRCPRKQTLVHPAMRMEGQAHQAPSRGLVLSSVGRNHNSTETIQGFEILLHLTEVSV